MNGPRTLGESFTDYSQWARDPRPRVGFGMPFFDLLANGGMAIDEITMLMAFSSVGKTTIALNVIRNNADVPVQFFSLEMSKRFIAARLAAMDVPTSTARIENDYRSQPVDHPPYIVSVVDRYPQLVIDDTPAIKLDQASESLDEATRILRGVQPRLVIFDYLELIGGSGMLGKAEQVDKASQKLRDWTRKHGVSTLLLHQVGKGDSPDAGAVPLSLDSGRYGGYAPMDYVIGAYAPRLERGLGQVQFNEVRDQLFMQLLKNRAGAANPSGVKHRMDHKTLRISEWDALSEWSAQLPYPQENLS